MCFLFKQLKKYKKISFLPITFFVGNVHQIFLLESGVARVPCALGQEIFLRPLPPSTKTTGFKVKNWCKSAEEAKAEHLL